MHGQISENNQPIIRAANGKVSDEEALARWCDPIIGVMEAEWLAIKGTEM